MPQKQGSETAKRVIHETLPVLRFDPKSSEVLNPYDEAEFERLVGDNTETGTHYTERMYRSYNRALNRALSLTTKDLVELKRWYKQTPELQKSNAHVSMNAPDLLMQLHETGEIGNIRKIFDSQANEIDLLIRSVKAAIIMMRRGSLKVLSGEVPDDESDEWATTLYGQANGLEPRSQVHFVLSHVWGRMIKRSGIAINNEAIYEKDAVWSLVSLGLSLQVAEGTADPEIVTMWTNAKPKGVSWHKNKEVGKLGEISKRQQKINEYVRDQLKYEPYSFYKQKTTELNERYFANILERAHKKHIAVNDAESEYNVDLRGFGFSQNENLIEHCQIVESKSGKNIYLQIRNVENENPVRYPVHVTIMNDGTATISTIKEELQLFDVLTEVLPLLLRAESKLSSRKISFMYFIDSSDFNHSDTYFLNTIMLKRKGYSVISNTGVSEQIAVAAVYS